MKGPTEWELRHASHPYLDPDLPEEVAQRLLDGWPSNLDADGREALRQYYERLYGYRMWTPLMWGPVAMAGAALVFLAGYFVGRA